TGPVYGGGVDVTLARISADGKQRLWATYLGGGNLEWCYGLVQERSGSFLVAGLTQSANFPVWPKLNAFSTSLAGSLAGFVRRISGDGSQLLYSSYLGGSADDWVLDIDVDLTGVVTLVGCTNSGDFPTTETAYRTTPYGMLDTFVTRVRLNGNGKS